MAAKDSRSREPTPTGKPELVDSVALGRLWARLDRLENRLCGSQRPPQPREVTQALAPSGPAPLAVPWTLGAVREVVWLDVTESYK